MKEIKRSGKGQQYEDVGGLRFGGRGGFGNYKHYEQKGVTHGQRKP